MIFSEIMSWQGMIINLAVIAAIVYMFGRAIR